MFSILKDFIPFRQYLSHKDDKVLTEELLPYIILILITTALPRLTSLKIQFNAL